MIWKILSWIAKHKFAVVLSLLLLYAILMHFGLQIIIADPPNGDIPVPIDG
ncbi:MAG: hypothetical protein ACTSSP_05165 [Candidatus Asgardarchaeia archaeon]